MIKMFTHGHSRTHFLVCMCATLERKGDKTSSGHVSEEVKIMEAFPNWDSRSNETASAFFKPTENWLGFTIAEEMCSGVARPSSTTDRS